MTNLNASADWTVAVDAQGASVITDVDAKVVATVGEPKVAQRFLVAEKIIATAADLYGSKFGDEMTSSPQWEAFKAAIIEALSDDPQDIKP